MCASRARTRGAAPPNAPARSRPAPLERASVGKRQQEPIGSAQPASKTRQRRQDMAIDQGISRRSFNAALAGAGATAAAPWGLARAQAQAQTPRRGGRLVCAFNDGASEVLDPARTKGQNGIGRCCLLYSRLVDMSPQGQPVPGLAESWEPNAAADTWTFKLRRGVQFHNGKTMTTKDVVWTLERVLDAKTASSGRALLADIAEIKATDDHTLELKLKQADADFPVVLTAYQAMILPEGHSDFLAPIGTGPFMHSLHQPGIRSVFKRHPNYWKSGRPYVDEVESFAIADPVARINALLAGEINAMITVEPKQVERVKSNRNCAIVTTTGPRHYVHGVRCDTAPYDKVDVRLALKHAIDRERYRRLVLGDYAIVANDLPILPSNPYYNKDLPQRAYDPDKVKFHLRKAGEENTQGCSTLIT
ncbi:MAG: ABC transporter substrate-binding protein [Alphaproteobacteria bacterium]|nr:ABC transporter substrate-binding protein [Alphaproteobacteria bacterium]